MLNPPSVYLAGKIAKNCWRQHVVRELRGLTWDDAPVPYPDFQYVGPFFTSCDHGCLHWPTSHGLVSQPQGCERLDLTRREIRERCLRAIDQCDLFFAYINTNDCYGTIAETQRAHDRGKYVVVAFAPQVSAKQRTDLWFAFGHSNEILLDIDEESVSTNLANVIVRITTDVS